MLTVDFRRFPVRPGQRVLDLGCGGGRHAFEVYRRGADVVAFDLDPGELAGVRSMFGAMQEAGEAEPQTGATAISGDATAMPFGDGTFDRVIAAEILEHVLDDQRAMNELARVLRPGGLAAITVPSLLPERICWALSTEYHEVPGGHVRIYTRVELEAKLARAGLRVGLAPPRARPALALLVAEVRGRCAQRQAPAGQRLSPDAGLGHHAQAGRHPAGRAGAESRWSARAWWCTR